MLEKLRNVFSTFVKKTLTEKNLDDAINELRILLISNDVAVDTADEICKGIIESFKGQQITRLTSTKKMLFDTLKEAIIEILTPEKEIDIIKEIKENNYLKLPYILVFLQQLRNSRIFLKNTKSLLSQLLLILSVLGQ